MGCAPQLQKLYQIETKILILVVGVVFSVFLILQSSSLLPYKDVVMSVLGSKSANVNQSALVHNSNSTDSSAVLGVVNNTVGTDVRKEVNRDGETLGNNKDPDNDSRLEEDQADFEYYSEESAVENAAFPDHNSAFRKSTEQGISDKVGSNLTFIPLSSPRAVTTNLTVSSQSGANSSKTDESTNSEMSPMGKEATKAVSKAENAAPLQTDLVNSTKSSTITSDTATEENKMPAPTSISKMTSLLLRSRVSSSAMRPRWSSVRDQELLLVKSQIESASRVKSDPELYAPLYRNVSMFKRSYELMENMLKVYIYDEGEKPVFHQAKLKGIYASEGWFMKLMEGNKQFVTKDPTEAHMFYLPFSALNLRLTSTGDSQHHKDLAGVLKNYVDVIAGKYPFWNRTGGADHFFVACHDWAPRVTIKYMGTCIRALCNANVARAFKLGKDVSFPVTMVRFEDDPLRSLGGKPPSKRPFLAFFAGKLHGYVRPILLQYWGNKDPDIKIFGPLPRNSKPNYLQYMKSSKYCICARGYEVHTPRVVEAIFHECVPVIISDNYVPPFFEVLNWEAFSVFILEKDIPNLKKILLSIPKKRYLEMQMRVKKVQKHFLWHKNPVKYDIFHMTLHSIWYNRVFQIKPR